MTSSKVIMDEEDFVDYEGELEGGDCTCYDSYESTSLAEQRPPPQNLINTEGKTILRFCAIDSVLASFLADSVVSDIKSASISTPLNSDKSPVTSSLQKFFKHVIDGERFVAHSLVENIYPHPTKDNEY